MGALSVGGNSHSPHDRLLSYRRAVEDVSKTLSGGFEADQLVIHDVIGKVRPGSLRGRGWVGFWVKRRRVEGDPDMGLCGCGKSHCWGHEAN